MEGILQQARLVSSSRALEWPLPSDVWHGNSWGLSLEFSKLPGKPCGCLVSARYTPYNLNRIQGPKRYGETAFDIHRRGTIHNTRGRIYTRAISFDANIPLETESGYIHTRSQITTGPETGLEIENKSLSRRSFPSYGFAFGWAYFPVAWSFKITMHHARDNATPKCPGIEPRDVASETEGNRMLEREREREKGRWTRQRGREGQGGTERADIGQCAVG